MTKSVISLDVALIDTDAQICTLIKNIGKIKKGCIECPVSGWDVRNIGINKTFILCYFPSECHMNLFTSSECQNMAEKDNYIFCHHINQSTFFENLKEL